MAKNTLVMTIDIVQSHVWDLWLFLKAKSYRIQSALF